MHKTTKKWSRIGDYVVLKVLDMISRVPLHGYGILKNLEEEFGVKLSPGLLYPILRRMVKMGLAVASETSIGSKRVVIYEITPMGREFLEKRRNALETFERKALKIKQCRIHELIARLRYFIMNIDKLSEKDLEKLRNAANRFLEDTRSIEVRT